MQEYENATDSSPLVGYGSLGGAKLIKPYSPLEQLKTKKQMLEGQLADVNAAITALEKNPEVSNILELLVRANVR